MLQVIINKDEWQESLVLSDGDNNTVFLKDETNIESKEWALYTGILSLIDEYINGKL